MSDTRYSTDAAPCVNAAIPETGKFTAEQWGEFFTSKISGKPASKETVRTWCKDNEVPVRIIGNQLVVDAERFWDSIEETVLE